MARSELMVSGSPLRIASKAPFPQMLHMYSAVDIKAGKEHEFISKYRTRGSWIRKTITPHADHLLNSLKNSVFSQCPNNTRPFVNK